MRKNKYIILIILASLLLFSGKEKDYRSYVVLVSLDAWRWDYSTIYDTPELEKLGGDGVKAERLIPSFPTNTFPNHYTIATGLYPDHHGLVNNTFPAPELGLMYRIGDRSAVENPAFYGGEPVWVTARKQGIVTASFFWVGSEAPVGGMHPDYWKKYDDAYSYESRIDTVIKWLSYPAGRRPGLVTLYFDEPDATSHDYGPVSAETGAVAERLDSLIGVLRTGLASLPFSKRINLIVLSDHGMARLSPSKYVNLRQVVPDRMIDGIYGSNPVYLINPVSGKKDSVLLLLNSTDGIKAYRKEEVPARLNYGTHPRIPELVVIGDSSWSVGTRPDGSSYTGGAHGYDNANTDMHAIFYASGPAFKKGHLIKQLNNTDIYNIVCRIMNIIPAPNDGDPEILKQVLRK